MAMLEEAVHSREAEAVIANAVSQAQLNQDQMNEELDVWRNDPLRKEQRTFQEQTGNPFSRMEITTTSRTLPSNQSAC